MTPGPDSSAFTGLADLMPDGTEDPLAEDVGTAPAAPPAPEAAPAPAEPAAPAPEAEPEAPAAPEPAEGEPAAPEGAEPAEGEQEPAEPPKLLAGKYKSVEELERGYRESVDLIRRQGEDRNRIAAEHQQLQQAVQEFLSRPQPAQQQQAPAAPPEPTEAELAQIGLDREQWRALAPMIEQQVAARVMPLEQQWQTEQQRFAQASETERVQREAQAELAAAAQAVQTFRTSHPEYAPQSEQDSALADLIRRWNGAWTGDPDATAHFLVGSFEIGEVEALEVAHEALGRPALADVLAANPSYIDSEAGMAYARQMATLQEATAKATTKARQAAPPASPHVERGGTGAPAQRTDGTPRDEFTDVLELDQASRQRSAFHG